MIADSVLPLKLIPTDPIWERKKRGANWSKNVFTGETPGEHRSKERKEKSGTFNAVCFEAVEQMEFENGCF